MENTDYQISKNQFLLQPVAYKEVAQNEIVAMDGTHYKFGTAEVTLTPDISEDIDSFIGVTSKQSKLAEDSFGETGVANLRNFFAQANRRNKDRLVVVANTQTRKVTHVLPTKKHLIPPETFFDFAEMFMDKSQYEPDAIEYNDGSEVSIRMRPIHPQFMSFTKDDDFISNGLWLKWTPVEIAFGNYYERLVCRNGMTQITLNKQLRTNSLEDEYTINAMLGTNADNPILRQNLVTMLTNARAATVTSASVRELGCGVRLLKRMGVPEEEAAKLIPYEENVSLYERAGHTMMNKELAMAISNMNVWQLFNILTAFASHTTLWGEHDIRRSMLMSNSVDFLNSKRDIKDYYNIYA